MQNFGMTIQHCLSQSKAGDIFFVSEAPDESGFGNAVANSYSMQQPDKITHVGIINNGSEGLSIIHAVPGYGVLEQQLSDGFSESNNQYITIKRVTNISPDHRDQLIEKARKYVGSPYNDIFADDHINSKGQFSLYCSQLVESVYNDVTESEIFHKHPMSFGDDWTTQLYWKFYFWTKLSSVPEGEPGTHPGSIYENENLEVVCSVEIGHNDHTDEL